MDNPRILIFDIETTHLKADFGTLIVFGYKWLGDKKPTTISLGGSAKDALDDSGVAKYAAMVLASADLWVTYFGKGFDVKFLNAKMLEHGLPVLPNIPHVDMFYAVKSNLALSRKSLANVSYFLGTKDQKSAVEGRIWKRAGIGDPKAMKYIIDHCKADVNVLEEVYLRMRSLVRTHPRVQGLGPCRFCGSEKMQSRGYALSVLRGRVRRVQCQSPKCLGWDTRTERAA